jgi:hypothetical protein
MQLLSHQLMQYLSLQLLAITVASIDATPVASIA